MLSPDYFGYETIYSKMMSLMADMSNLFHLIDLGDVREFKESNFRAYLQSIHEGDTLLSYAVRQGKRDIVLYLVSGGANVASSQVDGCKILCLAAQVGDLETFITLASYMGHMLYESDFYGRTPLTVAAREGHYKIVEFLISKGVVVYKRDTGEGPMAAAAKGNNVKIMELFVANGSLVDSCDASENTPMMYAARLGCVDAVEWLVDHKADFNRRGQDDMTPIFWAIQGGHLEVVKILANRGADINVICDDSYTPLSFSIKEKEFEIAKFLIKSGANICKKGSKGKSPLSWAVINDNLPMVKSLLHDPSSHFLIPSALYYAICKDNVPIITYLLTKGADLNKKFTCGYPLYKPIIEDNFHFAKFLIDEGAKVALALEPKETISTMTSFIERGNHHMVELLVENGAEWQDANNTLLVNAIRVENLDMVKYLVKNGADVNKPSGDGAPLVQAAKKSNVQIFEFLLGEGADFAKQIGDVDEIGVESNEFMVYLKMKKGEKEVAKVVTETLKPRKEKIQSQTVPETDDQKLEYKEAKPDMAVVRKSVAYILCTVIATIWNTFME